MNKGDYIEYPGYDKAWIAWETDTAYLINKIKKILNDEGKTSFWELFSKIEIEWILKTDFNYKKIESYE
jgi:hypothetical protein